MDYGTKGSQPYMLYLSMKVNEQMKSFTFGSSENCAHIQRKKKWISCIEHPFKI